MNIANTISKEFLGTGLLRWYLLCAVITSLSWVAAQVPTNASRAEPSQKIRKVTGRYSDLPPEAEWSDRDKPNEYALRIQENHTQFHLLAAPLREGQTIVRIYDYRAPEALPVKLSSAVIIGSVASAQAIVAAGANAVYSEYGVLPTRIIKQNYQSPISAGYQINVMRDGGAVRFPSGAMSYVLVKGRGFPKVGTEYVWFLRQDADTGPSEYEVRTAYQLTAAGVLALDDEPPYRDVDGLTPDALISRIVALVTGGGSQ